MLGALPGGDQTGIHRLVIEVLFHDRFAFLDDAGDAVAMLAAHLLTEALEDPFEAFDLALRLLEMGFERVAQRLGRSGLGEFDSALVSCFSAS